MKPLYEDDSWDIEIQWSRPRQYELVVAEGVDYDATADLYMISARFSSRKPKSLYIGKAWRQEVSYRLSQEDHKKRYAAYIKNYPHHSLYVSHGTVTVYNGNLTEKRLSDIEKILIYSNDSEHASNLKSIYTHGVTGSYRLENLGSRCSLPKAIHLGIFVK